MKKEFSLKISNIAFICACLVVFIHSPISKTHYGFLEKFFKDILSRVAVPTFFMISGFLLAQRVKDEGWYGKAIKKRIKSLLMPLIILDVIWFPIKYGIHWLGVAHYGADGSSDAMKLTVYNVLSGIGIIPWGNTVVIGMWYVKALFLLVCISPILKWMFSFHPTKLFHSCEGGLLVFKDAAVQEKLYELRNFAIHGELSCTDVGSNAKMNELQALMGLECLKKIDALLAYRQKVYKAYEEVLVDCSEVRLVSYSQNKAYVPVLFKDLATRERVYTELKEKCNVFSRRYFYPLLTDFVPYAYGSGSCPVAEDLASRVLTLPTYFGLPLDDVRIIAENVKEIVCL